MQEEVLRGEVEVGVVAARGIDLDAGRGMGCERVPGSSGGEESFVRGEGVSGSVIVKGEPPYCPPW